VDLYSQAATLGVILPYSRGQESEADEIGLTLMAEAGYDPREAVKLWQNFEALGGERPPEFLSTHPAEGTRIERLQELMPEALQVYEANRQQ
jgi:predicted Zn-dependent protease